MNIPIYRAKKLDSDKYIQGYLLGMWGEYFISWGETNHVPNKVQVDPLTLAVHLKDMVDSEGNKIFASLSEDGKGGDIMKDDEYYGIAKYKDSSFVVEYENVEECLCEGNFEIIGIHK